jgi:hypothetical protein
MACIANATGAEPEMDIEITPEMVDAGIRELSRFVFEFDRETDAVEAVYRAMRLAVRGHLRETL